MSLVVDIGNSMIKVAVFSGNKVENYNTYPTKELIFDPEKVSDSNLFKGLSVDHALVSSVVPEANGIVKCILKGVVKKKYIT